MFEKVVVYIIAGAVVAVIYFLVKRLKAKREEKALKKRIQEMEKKDETKVSDSEQSAKSSH